MKKIKTYNLYLETNELVRNIIVTAEQAITGTDINDVCLELQNSINQDDGGVASMVFSNIAEDEEDEEISKKRGDNDKTWGHTDFNNKIVKMIDYIRSEISANEATMNNGIPEYEIDLDFDELSYNNEDELLDYVNAFTLLRIFWIYKKNDSVDLSDAQKKDITQYYYMLKDKYSTLEYDFNVYKKTNEYDI